MRISIEMHFWNSSRVAHFNVFGLIDAGDSEIFFCIQIELKWWALDSLRGETISLNEDESAVGESATTVPYAWLNIIESATFRRLNASLRFKKDKMSSLSLDINQSVISSYICKYAW